MNDIVPIRHFRLRTASVACDAHGLCIGEVPLLTRDERGHWAPRDGGEINPALSRLYGFPLDFVRKRAGLEVVAKALGNGEIARAQIAALLLQLPDPPAAGAAEHDAGSKVRLALDIAACGLLKVDDDWDAKHPRTGAAPNPGWFAPTGGGTGATGASGPVAADTPHDRGASGGAFAFVPPALAARASSVLAADLPAVALEGLATLAARASVPLIVFNTIFVPRSNALVEQGPVPGRPGMTYRWAHDETQVTFRVLVDGQWRTLTVGTLQQDGQIFRDRNGQVVARLVSGPDPRKTLVTTTDALDRALADLSARNDDPAPVAAGEDYEPKLCPEPTPERIPTKSENSLRYQEYITGLPRGWAINVGGLNFDGCDDTDGHLQEAKGDIDFMFDDNNNVFGWIDPDKNPKIQMENQAKVALAAGRRLVWYAQTPKGFEGLSLIAGKLKYDHLSVVYKPQKTGVSGE